MPVQPPRIYLSPPHVGEEERQLVLEAFDSNWIAPVGPHVDAFEQEFAEAVGAAHAVALSSGTAALHLGLRLCGVSAGDEVLVATFTFCASANTILYLGGRPTFIDSEEPSWNLDPDLVEEVLMQRARTGHLPKVMMPVHLYGQTANLERLQILCQEYGVAMVEDAAEALGSTFGDQSAGTFGKVGCFSFNGNKIITTSGGGMLVTEDAALAAHARKLATQAQEPAPHYEHHEMGYNYRLSNVLAGIGRGQLRKLEARVQARQRIFETYREQLGSLPGIHFMPDAGWGRHTRWLTCITVDPEEFGATREVIWQALDRENIDSRPLWKPMHLQPVYWDCEYVGGQVAERLFERGLCLPSGSSLTEKEQARVIGVIQDVHTAALRGSNDVTSITKPPSISSAASASR